MERTRQTHAKEMESRDEEVEEARQSCQKKVKQWVLTCPVQTLFSHHHFKGFSVSLP